MTTPAQRPAARGPAACRTMADIRAEIDRVDRALVALFAERTAYIDRAAAIKGPLQMPARIGPRVEEVVANVRAEAAAHGLPPDLIEKLWRRLIDWSIAREEGVLGPEWPGTGQPGTTGPDEGPDAGPDAGSDEETRP